MSGLETIAAIAAIGGTAVQAVGQIQAGRDAQQAANYNAKVLEQNAKQTVLNANTEATMRKRQLMKERSSAVAAYGASGVQINNGSPMAVLSDLATEAELDAALTRYQGEQQAKGLNSEAAMQRREGKIAKRNAITGAMGTLLSGASQAYGSFGRAGSQAASGMGASPMRATTRLSSGGTISWNGSY